MIRLFVAALVAAFALIATPALALDGGRYGEVKLAVPKTAPRGYVVLFSDAGGWTDADQARLEAIAQAGALAVGVDTDAYLARVADDDPRCFQLLGDTEGLSRRLQRQYAGAEYFFPIVAGVGKGGAVAGKIVAQAPPATIGGAVSLDPWSVLNTVRDFCPRVASPEDAGVEKTFGVPILKNFWTVGLSPTQAEAERAHFLTLADLVPKLDVRLLPSPPGPDAIASLLAPHLVPDDFDSVAGLPLIELPAEPQGDLMAVFLSGDGGWRDIDKTIGENLRSLGVSVVGWDSLRYFWRKKTPEETAADLSAVIGAYSAKWHARNVALIGFSFGADVLPFLYDRMRAAMKARVTMITLLSAGRAADWEIRVVNWLGAGPSAEATPLAPAMQEIPGKIMQCFYSEQDKGSYCPNLVGTGAEVIEKKGIHHFDGNYVLIAHEIIDGLNRRANGG